MEDLTLSPSRKENLLKLAKKFDIKYLAIFGSFARNSQKKESDLDLLVEFHHVPSLVRFITIENEISETLGITVDLVTVHSLNEYIREQVLAESKVIWEERT